MKNLVFKLSKIIVITIMIITILKIIINIIIFEKTKTL